MKLIEAWCRICEVVFNPDVIADGVEHYECGGTETHFLGCWSDEAVLDEWSNSWLGFQEGIE